LTGYASRRRIDKIKQGKELTTLMENEWYNGKVELSVAGTPFEMNFRVPAKSLKLRRMLPVFQKMSDTFNNIGIAALEENGKAISCKAGCGACCRQLVPVSEAEAFDLRGLVEDMPEPRRSEIMRRFADGIEKLNKISFFERLEKASETDDAEYSAAIREYFAQQIACPFLENESCSIHPSRPVACREYLVTSPAENCSSATGENIDNVEYTFKVKDTLISLARNRLQPELPYVPMIRTMEWTKEKEDESPERIGKEWMEMFFSDLVEVSRIQRQ
jgi:Fe-S-cluster containining protein